MSTVDAPPAQKAVFLASTKGGPGKTTAASLLLDNWRRRGLEVSAYDSDAGNASLAQHFGTRNLETNEPEPEQDPKRGCALINIREPDSRDELLNIVETVTGRILVDLPGGGSEDLAQILPDANRFFRAFVDHGIQPVVAVVISNVRSSAAAVADTIKLFGPTPTYVVVKNLAFGTLFPAFDGITVGGQRMFDEPKRALDAVGGTVLHLPKLHEDTYLRWDFASCTIEEGATQHPWLTYSDRERIKAWREDFAAAIEGTPLQ
jgi:hypothetical protein